MQDRDLSLAELCSPYVGAIGREVLDLDEGIVLCSFDMSLKLSPDLAVLPRYPWVFDYSIGIVPLGHIVLLLLVLGRATYTMYGLWLPALCARECMLADV